MSYLPSFCPDHPDAPERMEQETIFPNGKAKELPIKYFCSICNAELCSPAELKRRQLLDRMKRNKENAA
jgi:hypothetical protein